MTPVGEELLRVIAMGRGKDAALARMVLKAEGFVVAETPTLSMTPAAVRQRRSRDKRSQTGAIPPVTSSVTVTPAVTPSLSLSSLNHGDPEREETARVTPGSLVTPAVTPTKAPQGGEFPKETESSVRRVGSRGGRDSAQPVTRSRVTASDPLTGDLRDIAVAAGVADPERVWGKFTAWNDGKDKEMAKDWRLWCLRERGSPSAEGRSAEPRAPEASRVHRLNEGPVVLPPESECPPPEIVEVHLNLLEETLRNAGRGGVRKARIPPPPDAGAATREETGT